MLLVDDGGVAVFYLSAPFSSSLKTFIRLNNKLKLLLINKEPFCIFMNLRQYFPVVLPLSLMDVLFMEELASGPIGAGSRGKEVVTNFGPKHNFLILPLSPFSISMSKGTLNNPKKLPSDYRDIRPHSPNRYKPNLTA
jgi:hypothetical protein